MNGHTGREILHPTASMAVVCCLLLLARSGLLFWILVAVFSATAWVVVCHRHTSPGNRRSD